MRKTKIRSRKLYARIKGDIAEKNLVKKKFLFSSRKKDATSDQKLMMEMWDNYLNFTRLGI